MSVAGAAQYDKASPYDADADIDRRELDGGLSVDRFADTKKNVSAALTLSLGLSLARNRVTKGFFMTISLLAVGISTIM